MREVLARPSEEAQEEEQEEEQATPSTSSTNILAGVTKKMKLSYSKKVGISIFILILNFPLALCLITSIIIYLSLC